MLKRILIPLIATIFSLAFLASAQPPQDRPVQRPAQRPDGAQPQRPGVTGAAQQAALPPGVKAIRDIVYARPGNKPQMLDIYLPEKTDAASSLPLIVWIHGGAWVGGTKNNCPAMRMVPNGFVAASVNYRLSQEAIFPAQIEDCKAAIRWLRVNAGKYNIDPNRIGVWGSSAGGHLVALLGTSGDVKDLEGSEGDLTVSSRVQAVCDWFGPTDFLDIVKHPSNLKHDSPESPESKLIGGYILAPENKEKVARANPITYIKKDAPPFLIMHGDKDMTVPYQQSVLLHEALKKAGVDATFEIVPGAGHGFGGQDINKKVSEFFERTLKKK
ncbi:MAG: alpha/beta hydrolase [Candidatus Sumerlaeota bacterium]|nr:alpha/beta hydrolase [Candidatus Sumerlaeota bacterium]